MMATIPDGTTFTYGDMLPAGKHRLTKQNAETAVVVNCDGIIWRTIERRERLFYQVVGTSAFYPVVHGAYWEE